MGVLNAMASDPSLFYSVDLDEILIPMLKEEKSFTDEYLVAAMALLEWIRYHIVMQDTVKAADARVRSVVSSTCLFRYTFGDFSIAAARPPSQGVRYHFNLNTQLHAIQLARYCFKFIH